MAECEERIRRVLGRRLPPDPDVVLDIIDVIRKSEGLDVYVDLPRARSSTAVEMGKEIAKLKKAVELEHQRVETDLGNLRDESIRAAERYTVRVNELHARRAILERFLKEIGEES